MILPSDKKNSAKEFDKFSKYKDLKIEIATIWHLNSSTIPIVIGALELI